jgi:hypothetical protein
MYKLSMSRAGGYATITSENGVAETDTFSCAHCNRIVHVPVKAAPDKLGGWCRQCMKPICPTCVSAGHCDPLEKKLEREEARYHALRSYGLA